MGRTDMASHLGSLVAASGNQFTAQLIGSSAIRTEQVNDTTTDL